MTRRLEFGKPIPLPRHICQIAARACTPANAAPPHRFMVNVPAGVARVHRALSRFRLAARFQGALCATVSSSRWRSLSASHVSRPGRDNPGGGLSSLARAGIFYAVFPHNFMAALFGAVFVYAIVVALAIAVGRFWREVSPVTVLAPQDVAA